MTKNKILKICRPREGGDPCSQRHHATPKMDSRLRGKDNIIFVMYKGNRQQGMEAPEQPAMHKKNQGHYFGPWLLESSWLVPFSGLTPSLSTFSWACISLSVSVGFVPVGAA